MRKPKFYTCEICGYAHKWEWNGDCRERGAGWSDDKLDATFGPYGYELATMTERVAADSGELGAERQESAKR